MKTNIELLEIDLPGEGKRTHLLARDRAGKCVGTLALKLTRPVAEFSVLYVADGCRQKGVGSALVAMAAEMAASAGSVGLSCCVNPLNFKAQQFYANRGFVCAFQFHDNDFLFTLPLKRK